MHVNSWFQKFHGTQKIMACHDKYWCHKFKTQKFMVSQKITDCHEICDTLLPNSMSCHHHMKNLVIIDCKGQQYFQLANKWHESWCEVSITSHEVLQLLVNLVAMWHAMSASHNHTLLLSPKVARNNGILLLPNFGWLKIT
jgi:hypothetical protein